MKIIVTGAEVKIEELKELLSNEDLTIENNIQYFLEQKDNFDLAIDLDFDDRDFVSEIGGTTPLIVSSLKTGLATFSQQITCPVLGMNALPTFINRTLVEVSLMNKNDENYWSEIFNKLNLQPKFIKDRVGMITPRVVCMIINEAHYTVQEGTATEADIDLGMKLGTNYPKGPFEWMEAIGVQHVYEVLEALYDDTRDERYKIAPNLKRKYLLNH